MYKNVDAVLLAPYVFRVLWREGLMKRFVGGVDRSQSTLFPIGTLPFRPIHQSAVLDPPVSTIYCL